MSMCRPMMAPPVSAATNQPSLGMPQYARTKMLLPCGISRGSTAASRQYERASEAPGANEACLAAGMTRAGRPFDQAPSPSGYVTLLSRLSLVGPIHAGAPFVQYPGAWVHG
jgi:hypothetical protein